MGYFGTLETVHLMLTSIPVKIGIFTCCTIWYLFSSLTRNGVSKNNCLMSLALCFCVTWIRLVPVPTILLLAHFCCSLVIHLFLFVLYYLFSESDLILFFSINFLFFLPVLYFLLCGRYIDFFPCTRIFVTLFFFVQTFKIRRISFPNRNSLYITLKRIVKYILFLICKIVF